MTNDNKGGGVKKSHFCSDIIFEGPLNYLCLTTEISGFLCFLCFNAFHANQFKRNNTRKRLSLVDGFVVFRTTEHLSATSLKMQDSSEVRIDIHPIDPHLRKGCV